MQSEGRSPAQIEHLVERVMYVERVHRHLDWQRMQLEPIGQQFFMPVMGCEPQHTPGEVIM